MISYPMMNSFNPLDSYLYSFYPPTSSISATSSANSGGPAVSSDILEIFRPGKRGKYFFFF